MAGAQLLLQLVTRSPTEIFVRPPVVAHGLICATGRMRSRVVFFISRKDFCGGECIGFEVTKPPYALICAQSDLTLRDCILKNGRAVP